MSEAIDDRIRVIVQQEFRTELAPIFERLDKLNGWRNKLLGMAILAAFVSPMVAAALLR